MLLFIFTLKVNPLAKISFVSLSVFPVKYFKVFSSSQTQTLRSEDPFELAVKGQPRINKKTALILIKHNHTYLIHFGMYIH